MEDHVDALFGDAEVQKLLALSTTVEPLRICYPREVHVSRFMAWLLDPHEGHGLGDMAIRSLLTKAGQTEQVDHLTLNDRRFLSAASVHTQAYSSMILATEVDVGLEGVKRSLDVLAIDPGAKLYIAIENKFGAKQGEGQLLEYRTGLEHLYPGFRGVHIFLDSNELDPDDNVWLPIGYDWLSEFLRSCEQLESIAPQVKVTLAQFRSVLQEEDEEFAASSTLGKLITSVAGKFTEELSTMRSLVRPVAKSAKAKRFAELMGATNEAKASVRLLQLYCRRPAVWDKCFGQLIFAPHSIRPFDSSSVEWFRILGELSPYKVFPNGIASWILRKSKPTTGVPV